MEIALLAGAAVLLFGGNKIRDVARGLGAAKKEFTLGQAEADVAHERLRAEARAQAEANAAATSAPATGAPATSAPGAGGAPAGTGVADAAGAPAAPVSTVPPLTAAADMTAPTEPAAPHG